MGDNLEARGLLAASVLVLGLVACAEAPAPAPTATAPADGATVALVAAETSPTELVVDVVYNQQPGEPGPRMVELHLGLGGGLGYLDSAAGDAAAAAGKDVIVQEQADGTLRVVLMATTNTNRLASGGLVRLWLARSGGGGEAVTLLDQRPVFAPPDADAVAVLGPPLVPAQVQAQVQGGAP